MFNGMTPGRRDFLKKFLACSAGITLGSAAFGRQPIPVQRWIIGKEGNRAVFPFFDYARTHHIGEYIPKDQGGKFIQMALLMSEDDHIITDRIRSGILTDIYGDPLSWDKFENTEIEKSVWLNRFYYLPSFARIYYITGNRSYLTDMMDILKKWIKDNPLMTDSPQKTYNWRDMQVAWRSIHLSWCHYLGEEALSDTDKTIITDLQKKHSEILLSGFGKQKLNEFNHQSHGALAMLYLGILYPHFENSSALITNGVRILNHHLEHAFYSDGGNVEQMFGYYPFEAHIFRDAFLLCNANGIEPPSHSIPMMQKMAGFMSSVARPDNTMPEINDSYPMPLEPSLTILNEITGQTRITATSTYFPQTQIAVVRGNGQGAWYLIANPASTIGAHSHAGRLGFELWYNGSPIITDSGCCSYDDPTLVSWFRTTMAHNTALIDGKTDFATSQPDMWAPKRTTANHISRWNTSAELTSLTMESPAEEDANASVKWSRSLTLVRNRFLIVSDLFETGSEHVYELLLHFPPSDISINGDTKTIVMRGNNIVAIIPADISLISEIQTPEALVSIKGDITKAPQARISLRKNKGIENHLVIFPCRENESLPIVKVRSAKNKTVLSVTSEKGKTDRILFKSKEISLL